MILEDDVRDANGRMLLAKGQQIADKHLTIFRMWGVPDVPVEDSGSPVEPGPATPDAEALRDVARALQSAFAGNDLTHPAVAEIFRQAVLYRGRQRGKTPFPLPVRDSGKAYRPIRNGAARRLKISRQDVKLPEVPSVIFKLNDTIADPFSSADDIAGVISGSPGLSALLLKIVNSAFYGFPSRIDSLTRAVAIIGSKEVSALAVGVITMETFKDIPEAIFDMQAFTRHSLACGVLSRSLAASANIRNTEQMFVSGLLHDIGRLVILRHFPGEAASMMVSDGGGSLFDREKAVLGFRHTDIAGDLFGKWKYPLTLEQNIVFHHRPALAQDPVKAGIVHLADMIAHCLGTGSSGEWRIPVLDPDAWQAIHLAPESLATIIPQALHHLEFMLAVFRESDV